MFVAIFDGSNVSETYEKAENHSIKNEEHCKVINERYDKYRHWNSYDRNKWCYQIAELQHVNLGQKHATVDADDGNSYDYLQLIDGDVLLS